MNEKEPLSIDCRCTCLTPAVGCLRHRREPANVEKDRELELAESRILGMNFPKHLQEELLSELRSPSPILGAVIASDEDDDERDDPPLLGAAISLDEDDDDQD